MKWRIKCKISFLIIFVLVFTNFISIISHTQRETPIVRNPEINDFMQENFDENEKFQMENATTIRYYDELEVLDGYTIFTARKVNATISSVPYMYNLVIVNMSGHIIGGFNSSTIIQAPEFVNSTTVMFLTKYNIALYNIKTGILETTSIPSGHHDVEYNPYTDTFLVLSEARLGIYNSLPIKYDDIYEYDKDGNILWFWNCSTHLPFNTIHYLGEVASRAIDWTHTNTLFWDLEENAIYYNPRNLDTFYKINKTTGEFIWAAGKLGNFTMYDKYGNEKDSLWYHSHSVERINNNTFILFDNDFYNQTNPTNDISRMVEVEVDEKNRILREVWSWSAPEEYYSIHWGDADRLPNGNRFGTFGFYSHPAYLVEVSSSGEIVWEYSLYNGSILKYGIYRAERFYSKPIIQLVNNELQERLQTSRFIIEINTWNAFKTRYHSNANVRIYDENNLLIEQNFQFKPYWQVTNLSLEITNLKIGKHMIRIEVENSDGVLSSIEVEITVGLKLVIGLGVTTPIVVLFMIAVPIIVRIRKKSRS